MEQIKALVFLAGLATALAGPFIRTEYGSKCASFCPENSKFGYEPGNTYEYGYESDVKTHIPGAMEEHSTVHMRATVRLEVLSRCELALVLRDVSLHDSNPADESEKAEVRRSAEFARALEKNPLRFAFVSGQIESVCPIAEESTWALNVKRAVLSGFQNTMNDFNVDFRSTETDVSGECPVTYHTEGAGWGGVITIKKTKEVLACTKRQNADTIFQTQPYKATSRMQSLPMMKGSYECEQTITKENVLKSSTCEEKHIFRPFSKDTSGASTDVITKLVYKKTDKIMTTTEGSASQPLALLFEHSLTSEERQQARRDAETTLGELCLRTTPDVRAEAPALFGKLVHQLKKLDVDNMVSLHRDVRTAPQNKYCHHADHYLHDAIPTVGTVASARLIRELILSGEVGSKEATMWLTSLAFVQEPTAAMLAEVTPLLKTEPLRRQAALAISSLVNNFCRKTASCGEVREVQAIVTEFENNLRGGCSGDHERVITSLKAIGNTGNARTEMLGTCISNTKIPMETRVAAVNAYRRISCSADRSELVKLYEDNKADSELRINAYLGMMVCPTVDTIRRVNVILSREEINQVGSFVWTHLTNLMETSSPLKQDIRQILEKETLRKEFNLDKRKFSRNIEKSTNWEMFNSGAAVESNIIWSAQSFVPRSASVNLTVDLFGHSVNLVEVGGRVEGLNSVLENFFDKNVPSDAKKEAPRDINNIDKQFDAKAEDTKASGFLRVFGNEISYVDLHDLDTSTLKQKFNYLEWLVELAKEHDIDISKSFHFLDNTVNIPTIAGFPLRLNIEGNAVTDIKMKGKLDLRNLAVAPHSLAVIGTVAPSAALEIKATMGVDAFYARTGVKTVDTFHTSTVADGKIELRDGKIFTMDINVPRERMEIFKAEHQFFVIHRESSRKQQMRGERLEASRCLDGSNALGLQLCGSVTVPKDMSIRDGPYVPLTSPAAVSITLQKRDTHSGFHLEAKALQEKNRHADHMEVVDLFKVSFNTPGSAVDREFTIDYKLNRAHKSIELKLNTPWKKADLSGSLTNTDSMKRITATAVVDTVNTYTATAELGINKNRYNTQFMPKVVITMPNKPSPTIKGTLLYRPSRKIDVDMSMENVLSDPMTLKGDISQIYDKKKDRIETSLDLKSSVLNAEMSGYVDRAMTRGKVYSSRINMAYTPSSGVQNRVTLNAKMRDQSSGNRFEYSGSSSVQTTLWPQYNTDAKFEVTKQGRSLSTHFEGSLAGSKRKAIFFDQNGLLNLHGYTKRGNLDATFKFPYMDMDYKLNTENTYKTGDLKSKTILTSDGMQHSLVEVALNRESWRPLKASADVKVQYPGRDMAFRQNIEQLPNKEYQGDTTLQLQKDEVIKLTANYKMLPMHKLTAVITSPFTPRINLNAHMNPRLANFQSKASVKYGNKEYSGEAKWTHSDAVTSGIVTLTHPDRKLVGMAETKKTGKTLNGNVNLKWDAGKDDSKKIAVNGEITLAKYAPAMSVKAEWYPNSFVELNVDGKYENRGGTCQLESELHLRSSFKNMKNIVASLTHRRNAAKMTFSAETSWAPGRKVDADVSLTNRKGWESVQFEAKVTTPFSVVRQAVYTLDYAKEENTLRANTKAQLNQKRIGLAISGSASLPDIDGSATFTSPFEGFEEITLTAKHSDNKHRCRSEGTFKWAPGKEISYNNNMVYSRQGFHITSSGEMTIATPFSGYRENKLTWKHKNDVDNIESRGELQIDRHKSVFDFKTNHVVANGKRQLKLDASIKVPGRDMKIEVGHDYDIRTLRHMKTDVMVQYAVGEIVHLTNEVDFGKNFFTENLKFTSPFQGFETVAIDMNNRINDNTFRGNNEVKWGSNNKIALDGFLKISGANVEFNAQVTSPFYDPLKLTVTNEKAGPFWSSAAKFEYAVNRAVDIKTMVGFGDIKKFLFEMTSKCPYLKSTKFDFEHKGDLRKFTTKTEFYHDLVGKFDLVANVDTANIKAVKIDVDLNTPYRDTRSVKMMYSHTQERKKYMMSSSIQTPDYNVVMDHEMTFVNWNRFSTESKLQYTPGKNIQLKTKFFLGKVFRASAAFTSPFESMENIGFVVESDRASKIEGEINLDKTRKITGNVEVKRSGKTVNFDASLATPFMGYKSMGVVFNLVGPIHDTKLDWAVNLENKRIASETVFAFGERMLNIRSTLTTPFRGFENTAITFTHTGSPIDFEQDGRLEYPGSFITLKNKFNLGSANLNLKTELKTTFDLLKEVIVDITHEGTWDDFKNSASLQINGEKYDTKSEFNADASSIHGMFETKMPSQEFSLTFNLNGNVKNFNNNFNIKLNDQVIAGNSNFKYRGNNIEGRAQITTPFEGYEKFSFVGTHRGPMTDFNCDYSLEFFGNRVVLSDEFKMKNGKIDAMLKLNTPFTRLNNFQITFNHEGEARNFKNRGEIVINTRRYTGKSELNLLGTPVTGSITFLIPEEFSLTFQHEGTKSDFSNSMTLKLAEEIFEGESMFQVTDKGLKTSMMLKTPFRKVDVIRGSFSHQGSLVDYQEEATFAYGRKVFSMKNTFKGKASDIDGKMELRTPFESLPSLTVEVMHKAKSLKEFQNNIDILYNNRKYGGNSNFKLSGTTLAVKAAVLIPEEYRLNINHAGPADDFSTKGELNMNGDVARANVAFKIDGDKIESSGSLMLPVKKYKDFSYEFKHEGGYRNFKTVGNIQSPIRNFNVEYNHNSSPNGFECQAVVGSNGKNIQGNLKFKKTSSVLLLDVTVDTPYKKYKNFGVHLNYNKQPDKISSSLNIETPHDKVRNFGVEVTHEGVRENFVTTGKVTATDKPPIVLEVKHQGHPSDFTTSAKLDFERNVYTGLKTFRYTDGSLLTTGSLDFPPVGTYSYSITHDKKPNGFSTVATLDTPHEEYKRLGFEAAHDGTLSRFSSSARVTPWVGSDGSVMVNHNGNMRNFESDAEMKWNDKKLTGDITFTHRPGSIEGVANVMTPFAGYEKFNLKGRHEVKGRRVNTDVHLETPFKQIRDPSFELQHTGGLKNFKTSVSIVSPVKSVRPIKMEATHQGVWTDFRSTGSIKYGPEEVSGKASFKKEGDNIDAMGVIEMPSEDKLGFTLNHENDGRTIKTKGTVETPHGQYKNLNLEITHDGNLDNFKTTVKVETPFWDTIEAEVKHEGGIRDFANSAFVEIGNRRFEGESQYKVTSGYEADVNGHWRIGTPYAKLRQAEITLTHTGKRGAWNGNVKGSYNRHSFDVDYNVMNKQIKKAEVTVREPRPMEFNVEVNPETGFSALLDWDTRDSKSNIKIDATARKIDIKAVLPTRTVGLTTEYAMEPASFTHKTEVQWSDKPGAKLSYEFEANRETRGQRAIIDGKLTFSSPLIKFKSTAEHTVVPGRRYLTEVVLMTSRKYVIRSDVKPDSTGFQSETTLIYPGFSKIDVAVDGKFGKNKVLYDGDIEVQYGGKSAIKFKGLIADQSQGYNNRYVTESSLVIPAIRFDASSKTAVESKRNIVSANWDVTYKLHNGRVMPASLHTTLNKKQEKMTIRYENAWTSSNEIEIEVSRTMNTDSKQELQMTGSFGDRTVSASVALDRIAPSVNGRFSYAPGKRALFFAGYENSRNVRIEGYRQISGRKVPDFSASAEMEGHIVKANAFLRPLLLSEVSDWMAIDAGFGRKYDEVIDQLAEELRAKSDAIRERAVGPIMEEVELLSVEFTRLVGRLERYFNNWVSRNDFYIRKVLNVFNTAITTVRRHLEYTLPETIDIAAEKVKEMYKNFVTSYDQWRRQAVEMYNAMYQTTAEKLTEMHRRMYSLIGQHAEKFQGSLLDVVNCIRTSPQVQSIINSAQAKAEAWVARLSDIVDRLNTRAAEILAKPEMSYIRTYLTTFADRVKVMYSYLDLKESFRGYLHRLRETGFGAVRQTTWRAVRNYLRLDETRVNKWSPETGEISAQAYIPYILHDLRSAPSINIRSYIDNIKSYIPDTDWAIWDTFYSYKPSSDLRDWIPPFKSHATVSGRQHYMTFDKKFYDFAGECSYLLARDFIDGTFAVMVNYNAKARGELEKSITVVHGKDQVEIKPNFGIEVNGKRTELPFITEHTAVYRVGNTLRVDSDHGMKIVCDLPHDRCTVSVTGWYFGKTAGLLGTYDNEPATDFTTGTGARASSMEAMAHSWTVGRRCRVVNRADTTEPSELSSKYAKCAAFFKSNDSPFRPCFRQVDPEPFLKMCLHDDTPCTVSSFYVSECSNFEVPIRMPRDCVSCSSPGGLPMSEGDEIRITGTEVPKEADIVFVMSHGDCNKELIEKSIPDSLIRGMSQRGINSVQFGLVGYGGTGMSNPHSHTLAGDLLSGTSALLSALKNFETTETQVEDPLEAIEFASHYPFRAGASKTIILVPCNKCIEKETTYSAVQENLIAKDIRFHMLIYHDFELKVPSKSPKTSFLFGFDRKAAYTNKDVKRTNLQGDRDLRRQMAVPKDLCVAITHGTDGSVFNARKLVETKFRTQKLFLDVFSRVTAKKGTPDDCQICECRSDEIGVGQTVCRSCEPRVPFVYSWELDDLPEPDLVIEPPPKASRMQKSSRGM